MVRTLNQPIDFVKQSHGIAYVRHHRAHFDIRREIQFQDEPSWAVQISRSKPRSEVSVVRGDTSSQN